MIDVPAGPARTRARWSREAVLEAGLAIVLLSLCLAAPAVVQAQESAAPSPDTVRVTTLAPIAVTAARIADAPPPVAAVEVDSTTLRRTQAENVYDFVRRAAGVEVHDQGQGPGYASDVVLRGFSSDHSSDVLLSIDGVPINLPVHGHVEGYADWSMLAVPAVSAFRVIPGTASPLHGDFAFGGVVEVFTAPDASGTTAGLAGSSYGDAGGWLRTGRRGERGGFALVGDARRQQGWRDNSDYWLGNGLLRGWSAVGRSRLEGGVAVYGSEWDSPGFVSVEEFNAGENTAAMNRTDGGSASRVVAHGRFSTLAGATGLETLGWVQRVRSHVYLTIPEDGALDQSNEEDRRTAVGGRLQMSRSAGAGDVSAGLDVRADATTYDLYGTEERARVSTTTALDGRYLGGGAFARWRGLVAQRIVLDLGARADAIRYRSRDRQASGAWRDGTDALLSPKLGARFLAGSGFSILASLSRGFRGAPGVIADPELHPVTAWATEVGVRYDGARGRAHLAFFRLDVSHERIQDPVTREIINTGGSVRQGITLDGEWRVGGPFLAVADATLNDAEIQGGGAPGRPSVVIPRDLRVAGPQGDRPILPSFHIEALKPGDPVPNVARYVGRIGIEMDAARAVSPRVALRISGPFTPIGEPSARTQPYSVLDVGASIRLDSRRATLELDLQNLLDTQYPEVRASGFINPGAPRTLRAALRFAEAR